MEKEQFCRYAYVLGKNRSLDIIELVHEMGWCKASDLADALDMHIATAAQYLSELEEIGVMEVREAKGKTRMVHEYRLRDPKIFLSLDISESTIKKPSGEAAFYSDILESLVKLTRSIHGNSPVKTNTTERQNVLEAIRGILEFNEERMGLAPTQKLVKRACTSIYLDHRELDLSNICRELPSRYFGMLKEGI